MAGTGDEEAGGVLAAEPLDAKRAGGTGAQTGHGAGVHQGERGAGGVVAQQGRAEDLRKAAGRVLGEPGGELEAEEAVVDELARADVHIRDAGVEGVIDHGPGEALALGLLCVGLLDGRDRVGHGEDACDIVCGQGKYLCHLSLLCRLHGLLRAGFHLIGRVDLSLYRVFVETTKRKSIKLGIATTLFLGS